MIAIIDYGMGNLRSVQKALEKVGAPAVVTEDPLFLDQAEKIVLPGVGAIAPAMQKLEQLGLIPAIKRNIQNKKPFLGICLGLQLLFEKSNEGGETKALGIIPGEVKRFASLKVPHMGWNQLLLKQKNCPLFEGMENKTNAYFCHSYYVSPKDKSLTATATDYAIEFTSSICQGNLLGVQFHPEKSQTIGLKILENFAKLL